LTSDLAYGTHLDRLEMSHRANYLGEAYVEGHFVQKFLGEHRDTCGTQNSQ